MAPTLTAAPPEAIAGEALLMEALLGKGLSPAAEQQLRLAAAAYEREAVAEAHLRRAQAIAPDHAAVLIGVYRFYFYKGRLRDALGIARLCIAKAAADIGLTEDWRQVQRHEAAFSRYEAALPRFFLFSLKAYAYLNLRLGFLDEGRSALLKLLDLDPSDKIGAAVLLAVLDAQAVDEEAA